jgi:HPt (histidine-containing phosphotransfer) domain-containing protein
LDQEYSGMNSVAADIINWATFAEARSVLGEAFVRVLGYFREDGTKSVAAIEEAMRQKDAAALVMPAHTLKGEALQFGADSLGDLAEEIEFAARHYVEFGKGPKNCSRKWFNCGRCSRQPWSRWKPKSARWSKGVQPLAAAQ